MSAPSKSSKKRLKFTLFISFFIVCFLIYRLGKLQVFESDELRKGALEQWTKSIEIKPKRGIIYDRNGKKLAVSVNAFTVWATPADIKDPEKTSKAIAEVLDIDEKTINEKITQRQSVVKIKQWITGEEANELRKLNLSGVSVVEDNKRYYPNENFASYILGFTDIDNNGLDGIEKIYDDYLTGTPGKWMKMTDAANRQLPYDGEKIYEPQNGTSIVLTVDETIQYFAEKAAQQALIEQKAKNVSVIVMEPNTGDILAMTTKPDFDPNNPREPLDDKLKKQWKDLPVEELNEKWYELWRNFAVSDIYEPGSTFKVITAAAALEENTATLDTHYYCNGFIRDIKGAVLKCVRWYNPHGSQSLKEAMNNSCNVAFVNMGRQLGKENFYKYIKAFGFGEKTKIDLLGEQPGIIPSSTDVIKEVNLATMSYGHGIAVTPIQLINAVSAISNGGDLMKPRLVKEMVDDEGKIVNSFEPEVIRKVVSKQTSKTVLSLLESVVSEGSGSRAYIPGYKVGGKTGTAQKIIDGRYAPGKYIGSFVGVAPIDNPQIAILVIVDEPSAGTYYGGSVAAPVAKTVLEETFNYLEIPPKYSEDDEVIEMVKVPDVRNKTIGNAGRILTELDLKYTTEYAELTNESKIIDQFPLPGVEVQVGSIVDLYMDAKATNKLTMPYLVGKSKDEVIKILNDMNLKYDLKGKGNAVMQDPQPGEEIDKNIKIVVKFE
ncbi:penicillin-binding transpeptidase domain-containing protein [Wansuia hejianensis]|uniref:PASTA domain-containing protein n=1 Tax=Wansuia hejianensis TaxID=2763667 RepID=A0A926IMK2_9FIRM|nr:penicillin-binding transpeptidase domain-containing protein [Wansuia hejianensis]MBC8590716.1 PASTA domain-containing protein [Wansuia hejianensis]